MPVADVQFFNVILFFHISAAVLAFGPTFGYAVFQAIAERHDPRSIPTVMRAFHTIDTRMGLPAVAVLIASGIYMTIDRWDFGDSFVSFGLAAIIVLLLLLKFVFLPSELKLGELAERDIAASQGGEIKLSEEYQAASKRVARTGTFAGLLVIITIYFMTAKPFL